MKKVEQTIKNLNIIDEYVVLACSYGPDSMLLLDLLKKEGFNIVVAHVNHKLRKESETEEEELKLYCKKNNLVFETMSIVNYPKGNVENNARIIRYNFFEKLLKKYDSKYLFTAHHGDDLVETVLMRLVRGSSFKGYGGFSMVTTNNNYQIIRPLIYINKEKILSYVKKNNIPHAIDHTNKENIYTRNRIRNNILPELKKENKNTHQKFLKFSELINSYEDYFFKETNSLYNRLYKNNKIDLNEFYLIDDIFKKRLLNKILFDFYKNDIDIITDKHTELILKLTNSEKTNSFITLPKKLRVIKFYNMLEFSRHNESSISYCHQLKKEISLELGKIKIVSNSNLDKSNYLIRLNSKEIKLPIFIRTRKNGDKIQVKNLKGTKKVNDIFIDNKVSTKERDIYPIITDSTDQILWIPGLKKSKFDKQKEESYDIIIKYEKKEKNEDEK
ncbi:MAG: tRNA lysidine(34) synthetase TilS [Bacilli bacterium]|nr:tRNA lysidine(34) synthetase TilS [Bacilli bacterium]